MRVAPHEYSAFDKVRRSRHSRAVVFLRAFGYMSLLMKEKNASRRPMLAVIGNDSELPELQRAAAYELGARAVDRGFRVVCGGYSGVMQAVAQGAHSSENYREGDTIGIGMSYRAADLNPWIDIAIPTGMGYSRNMLVVSTGDVVVAIGGGSGTLSEIALAWQIRRPVLVHEPTDGWAKRLAGLHLDQRNERPIEAYNSIPELVERAWSLVDVSRAKQDQKLG